jgi:glycosyltransferase involved in cell wall biosynthesis
MNFSIAMATFNGARFIDEQLASIRDQSFPPAELVVCDDGSTDDTVVIVERFAKTASFSVRLERNSQRLGVSENFLKAAALCRHDWIAFSDQDDVWDQAKLDTIRNLVRQRPSLLLVAHRAILVDDRLRPLGELLRVPPVLKLTVLPRMSRNFWLHPYGFTMAFDARLVREFPIHGRPVDNFDRWIFALATALGDVAYLPQPLAMYRRHDTNFSKIVPPVPWSTGLVDPKTWSGFAQTAELLGGLSTYLEQCAQSASTPDAALLADSARAYERMAKWLARRSAFYGSKRFLVGKAGLYFSMLTSGAYSRYAKGGLGWRAGLRDAAHLALSQTARLARFVRNAWTTEIQ